MWFTEHTLETSASPEAIWKRWSDPKSWPEWDDEIEWCRLDGAFQSGARGVLKPKGGPKAAFMILESAPNEAFSDETHLPLARMRFEHRVERTDKGSRFTHRVQITGPLGWFFARVIGRKMRVGLPHAMSHLAKLAEGQ
jgi:uncharacterized protein YndB with AHSA1/START domain